MRRHCYSIDEIINKETLNFIKVWRKKVEILDFLHYRCGIDINERTWRLAIDEFNNTALQEYGFYIAHSAQGYIATNEYNFLASAQKDYFKRAITMLKKSRTLGKLIGTMDNVPLDLESHIQENKYLLEGGEEIANY